MGLDIHVYLRRDRRATIGPMAGERHIATKYRTERDSRPRELELARLAARQHGCVSISQLRELGLSASTVRSRVATGKLHRLHRGVFAVGHPALPPRGRWMAAVLACGPGAVLSHRSAAALWGIRPSARAAIEVTLPRRARRRGTIDVHFAPTLRPADVSSVNGIPCTALPRTLLDLAQVVDPRALERAYEQAEVLGLLDLRAIEDLLAGSPGRRGAAVLRAVVSVTDQAWTLTRSELEERFLALCAAAGIPRPRVNAWVALADGGAEVDFLWPGERLIAETDGHRVHRTRAAFERDRRRDRSLLLAGWRVARFTWLDLVRDPDDVAATIRALLAAPDRVGTTQTRSREGGFS